MACGVDSGIKGLHLRVGAIESSTAMQMWRLTHSALDQYQERILPLIDQLENCINQDIGAGKVTEATDLFYWLGFDRMGDFIFSRTFNMLSRQEWHYIVLLMQRALSLLGPLSPVPWFIHIAFKLFPRVWILKDWFRMVAWCEEQMLKRLQVLMIMNKSFPISKNLTDFSFERHQKIHAKSAMSPITSSKTRGMTLDASHGLLATAYSLL